eukprot:COSAG05_NODE_14783_length_387_cov_0.722222_2_plen_25_part_01
MVGIRVRGLSIPPQILRLDLVKPAV